MKTSNPLLSKRAWSKAILTPAQEFSLTPLPIIQGKIPPGLRGTLYRNGPGKLERNGVRVGHWFDGDGAILAVHFTPPSPGDKGGVTATYRYVQTAGYQEEEAANEYLYGNYGMTPKGPFWQRGKRQVKNAANTSVLALPDKLLALWEGGFPYALDLQTLETKGIDDLNGLKKGFPYSAHYKTDPRTGFIYNFGVTPGATTQLNIYKSDASGNILQITHTPLEGVPLLHDFVLAGPYLVFFISPVYISLFPILFGWKSYCDSMQWKPELGTKILIFDCETLSLVSQGETDPWYQWHFANGYVDEEGFIIVDFARYDDFSTNERLREVAMGETHTMAESTLWRVSIDPQTALIKSNEQLLDRSCEFPIVSPFDVGQKHRYIYLSLHGKNVDPCQELYNAIACFDTETHRLTERDFGENCYPMEPIFVPDALDPKQGWLLTVVYDGNIDKSFVWVLDAQGCEAFGVPLGRDRAPLCILELPHVVPMGFHGTWKPAS